jgi:AcrR family transcriptional regulator
MSYEVVKTIRGRDYRYMVESYRDPQTGKVRNRWRYLGKGHGEAPPRRRARADETRAKLTRALEDLLEQTPWREVTAHDIAARAGVAPATLYRYFSSRENVLQGAAAHANDQLDARLAELQNIAPDRESERARLRALVIALVKDPPASAVLVALAASGMSGTLSRDRNARRRRAFERYFELVAAHGYAAIPHGERSGLALALSLIVQAFSYRAVYGPEQLRDEEYAALATTVERLIFI